MKGVHWGTDGGLRRWWKRFMQGEKVEVKKEKVVPQMYHIHPNQEHHKTQSHPTLF